MKVIFNSILLASIDEPNHLFESCQNTDVQENDKNIDGSNGGTDNLFTIQSKDQPIQTVEFVEPPANECIETSTNQSEMTKTRDCDPVIDAINKLRNILNRKQQTFI